MAVHVKCIFCGHAFSVPDDMRGKRMACPNCGQKVRILDEEQRKALELRMQKERAEERAKIAEARREALLGKRVVPSHYDNLRLLARVLAMVGYLAAIVAAVFGFLYVMTNGSIFTSSASIVVLIALFVLALLFLVVHKVAAEVLRLAADIGDAHNDTLQLLKELRDIMRSLSVGRKC
ncbi:MAG: hypothetical protein DRP82_03760 [Planctomycetota bacterium]|nr:MAG: hypothetical protein DRP82_03760 [Planctomycetota bacterium]